MIIDDSHGRVTIRKGAYIEDTAVLIGPCEIGADSYIGHNAIIGAPAQYKGFFPTPVTAERAEAGVIIGNNVTIRELTQIHQGILMPTTVCSLALLMAGCHIAHDSFIGPRVTLGSFTVLGGHTTIDDDATFGQGVVTHPWVIVGEGAMVGLNSSVTKDVLPYQKVAGSPARLLGKNTGAGGDKEAWDESVLDPQVWEDYHALCRQRDEEKNRMEEYK